MLKTNLGITIEFTGFTRCKVTKIEHHIYKNRKLIAYGFLFEFKNFYRLVK